MWNFCQQWVIAQKITENGLWTAFDLTSELPGYSVAHQSNPEDVEFTFLSQSRSKQFSISELLWPLKKTPKTKKPSYSPWQELACSPSEFWPTVPGRAEDGSKSNFCNPFPQPTVLFTGLLGYLDGSTKVFFFVFPIVWDSHTVLYINNWWVGLSLGHCCKWLCSHGSTEDRCLRPSQTVWLPPGTPVCHCIHLLGPSEYW